MNNTRNPFTPEECLYSRYGHNPPVQAIGRLKNERILLKGSFYDDLLLISHLRECAKEAGTDVSVGGNLGASFIAWLYGCTDVNPLPPHYYYAPDETAVFYHDGDGWDMPPLMPDGKPILWDGHEIPVESLTPWIDNPDYQLDIRLAASFTDQAVEIIRNHYRQQNYTLVQYSVESPEPGDRCFVLLPKDQPLLDIAPDGLWHTDMEELYAARYRIIILIYDERKEQIRKLQRRVDREPSIIDLFDEPVLATTRAKIQADIEKDGRTLLVSDKLCFSSLLSELGYLRSSYTEDNPVYRQEGFHYSDVFTYREQVWDLVQDKMNPEFRLSSELPLFISKRVRCGMFEGNRMDPETERVLRGLGISEHWIAQMKHTRYLPCKADLIQALLDVLTITWFEQHDSSVHNYNGRFMLYNGVLRPSVTYFAAHTLPGYTEDDWCNDAYDVNDDEEILHMKRVCSHCGKEFTLLETAKEYDSLMGWPYYTHKFVGDLCYGCAIEEMRSRFPEYYDEKAGD